MTAKIKKPKVKPFPALAWEKIPDLVARLVAKPQSTQQQGLLAIILTAMRINECIESPWANIDEKAKVWKLPDIEMKGLQPHEVPISPGLARVLGTMRPLRTGPFIFAAQYRGDRHADLAGPIKYLR